VSYFIQSEASQITYKELEVKRKKMAEQNSPALLFPILSQIPPVKDNYTLCPLAAGGRVVVVLEN
jgi:hypothetical protein